MVSTIKHRYTLDEYRAIEERAEGCNEYRDGEIAPIPGGTLEPSRIRKMVVVLMKNTAIALQQPSKQSPPVSNLQD